MYVDFLIHVFQCVFAHSCVFVLAALTYQEDGDWIVNCNKHHTEERACQKNENNEKAMCVIVGMHRQRTACWFEIFRPCKHYHTRYLT